MDNTQLLLLSLSPLSCGVCHSPRNLRRPIIGSDWYRKCRANAFGFGAPVPGGVGCVALRRHIRVIPVLVDGASMPQSADLPDDLKPLVRRNALLVGDTHFDDDCRRLMAAIEQVLDKAAAERREREEKGAAGARTTVATSQPGRAVDTPLPEAKQTSRRDLDKGGLSAGAKAC